MTLKAALTSIFLLFIFWNVNAECFNDIKTEEDLVLSNICTYTHSALVKIESVSMKDKFNPIAYLKDHRIYILEANVLETFKGDLPKKMCMTQWREGDFDAVQSMEGKQYIVSINMQDKCSVVDTGAIIEATSELTWVARSTRKHLADAFNRLSQVNRFAFGGTGIAGVTSQGELDFRVLFESQETSRMFRDLFNKGNLQAKFYALVAFKQIDESTFLELIKAVDQKDKTLTTMSGCIVMAIPVEQEIERIRNGEYSFFFSEEYYQQLSWKNKLHQTEPSHK